MKKLIAIAMLCSIAGLAMAQNVNVTRESLGSGQPELSGTEQTTKWDNNVFHAPQYMPGYPTAATLYPRVIDVPCLQTGTTLQCKGYNWSPDMGRGEYLMVRPVIVKEPVPLVVTNTVTNNFIKEVPVPAPLPLVTKQIKE